MICRILCAQFVRRGDCIVSRGVSALRLVPVHLRPQFRRWVAATWEWANVTKTRMAHDAYRIWRNLLTARQRPPTALFGPFLRWIRAQIFYATWSHVGLSIELHSIAHNFIQTTERKCNAHDVLLVIWKCYKARRRGQDNIFKPLGREYDCSIHTCARFAITYLIYVTDRKTEEDLSYVTAFFLHGNSNFNTKFEFFILEYDKTTQATSWRSNLAQVWWYLYGLHFHWSKPKEKSCHILWKIP